MGVVKNLMVRIGADVRGVVGGMKTAYQSTRQATSQIKNATADMKRSVKDSFSGSRMSIREYRDAISSLKASQNAAVQNSERLQEKLDQMKSVYASLEAAAAELDLSTPLTAQIKEAEESWHGLLNEAQKVKEALKKEISAGGNKDNSEKIANLRQQLHSLREKASEAELELQNLKAVAATIGSDNIGFASTSGMGNLRSEMQRIQRELEISQIKAGELGQKLKSLRIPQLIKAELKSIGAAARSAAREGVAQLGSKLKSLGGSVIKGIATLPFQLLNIGKGASASNTGLEKMVRSIRNIGIVSLGMRVVGGIFRGIFGELQGIISSYISQNEELNATISNMKTQLGQALAPAINAVIAVMQRLMPVIQTIASVINGIFTTLFGKVKTTTTGIKSTAAAAKSAAATAVSAAKQLDLYNFDQINRESDSSSDSGAADTGGSQGADSMFDFGDTPPWLDNVLGWIEKMKAAFKAGDWEGLGKIFGDGINKAVDAINAVDIGTKVGTFVNNLFTTLNSALATIDFFNIGKKIGDFVTAGVQAVNWNTVGETIGRIITALPSVVVGFILNTDWGLIGQSLSNALGSMFNTIGEWIRSVDWLRIGDSIWQFIQGLDYGAFAQGFYSFLGSALRAGVDIVVGFIRGVVDDIKEYFAKKIEECGGNVALGLLKGILDGLLNLGEWVYENIVEPFFSAFCSGFGIHSPSTIMHEHGGNVIKGFFNGILEALGNVGKWVNTHIVTPFLNWITSLFGITDRGSILKTLGSNLIKGLLDGISETWESVESYLDTKIAGLENKFSQGWVKIKTSTITSWKEITASISDMRTAALETVEDLRTKMDGVWAGIGEDANSHVSRMTDSITTGVAQIHSAAAESFRSMHQDIRREWEQLHSYLISSLSLLQRSFTDQWSHIELLTNNTWKQVADTVSAVVDEMAKRVTEAVSDMYEKLSNLWPEIADDAIGSFQNMQSSIISICSNIISAVRAMSDSVRSMCNASIANINAVNRAAATVAYGSSSYSSGVSTRSISSGGSSSGATGVTGYRGSVSYVTGKDYTGGAGGSSMHLATGGVTTGPTYALIGEAGREVVMPLERNTGWMDTLAQRIHAFGGAGQTSSVPMVFKFYVGGKKLSQHVIKDINSITQTTGVCPITV